MDTEERSNDYDSEPVRYCARCYSLKIKYDESLDSEYCADCGCTDILEVPIEVWEEKYERRYGSKFTVKSDDPRNTFIFNRSTEQLKMLVFDHPKWREIIKSFYPRFPGAYSRADSVILFFDKLIHDSRLTEFRLFLVNYLKH